MKLHEQENVPEPFKHWKRKQFLEQKPDGVLARAERETDRDLEKDIEQLLCDVHDAHQRWRAEQQKRSKQEGKEYREEDDPVRLVLYSLARTASMNARVAISNKRMARAMFSVAFVATVVAILSLIVSLVSKAP